MQKSEKEVRRKVCERGTIFQMMVYERGIGHQVYVRVD